MFSMCTMTNAIGWITFAPIFDLVQELYGIGLIMVNYLGMSYMIWFLPSNFPSVKGLDTYGLRKGLLVGIIGTTIGCWLKVGVNSSFWFVTIGRRRSLSRACRGDSSRVHCTNYKG